MKNNQGFTLIEVLASIVLLGLLLTSFFQFFTFSQQATTNNKEKLVAVNIAQNVLEQINDHTYPEITDQALITGTTYPKIYEAGSVCTSIDEAVKNECLKRYQKTENSHHYVIKIEVGEKGTNSLHSVKVRVYDHSGKLKSSVNGVIPL